jgi:tetratricopeptide (TPR) repeat protein
MLTHEKRSRFLFFALGIVFVVAVVFYFTSANGLFAIGNFFFGGGAYDVKLAGKFYEMTLKKDPEFPRANYQLGRTYFIRGDFSASWYYIEKEIKYYPDFPKSYYMRGLIFGYVNHLDAAENDFKKFLSLKPNSWAGYNDLSWVYFKKGDFRSMEDSARRGIAIQRGNPWLLNALGLALFNEGRLVEAEYYFKVSIDRFEALGPRGWGVAYPGNDPKIYKEGYEATLKVIRDNLSKITVGTILSEPLVVDKSYGDERELELK